MDMASLMAQWIKNLPANARYVGLILGLGRAPGEGNGNLLQYSCLGSQGRRTLASYRPLGHERVHTTLGLNNNKA